MRQGVEEDEVDEEDSNNFATSFWEVEDEEDSNNFVTSSWEVEDEEGSSNFVTSSWEVEDEEDGSSSAINPWEVEVKEGQEDSSSFFPNPWEVDVEVEEVLVPKEMREWAGREVVSAWVEEMEEEECYICGGECFCRNLA